MIDFLQKRLFEKKVLILGFGKEGQSSYKLLKNIIPHENLWVADIHPLENIQLPSNFELPNQYFYGNDYLTKACQFDFIIKTPGISIYNTPLEKATEKITSQTDLFIKYFKENIIGVTGTKGKSTTASLIHHILLTDNKNTILAGNIGLPLFETIDKIKKDTIIVCELSSHQLEHCKSSPHISILLNLYQEHLDHYQSYEAYQEAKLNIAKYQSDKDYFLYNTNNEEIDKWLNKLTLNSIILGYSEHENLNSNIFIKDNRAIMLINNIEYELFDMNISRTLAGKHNLTNTIVATAACKLLGVNKESVHKALQTFKPLPHRIEFVAEVNGILFYNDSIATIPEASIEAIEALQRVNTLILGGFDRGIDYSSFAKYLSQTSIENYIFIEEAGKKIMHLLQKQANRKKAQDYMVNSMAEAVEIAIKQTKKNHICLLSPAAASYGMFKNFEERGDIFKNLIFSNMRK